MKKKILIASAIIFIILIMSMIGWSLYVEMDTTYKGLEFVIPIFCKNDVTKLSYKNLFDEEKLEKMYLSKKQAKRILKDIENNNNWIKGDIDKNIHKCT